MTITIVLVDTLAETWDDARTQLDTHGHVLEVKRVNIVRISSNIDAEVAWDVSQPINSIAAFHK